MLRSRIAPIADHGQNSEAVPTELTPPRLSSLVNSGTNLLLAVSPESSDVWRELAREFEIDFEDRRLQTFDHFNYDLDADDGSHTTLVLPVSHVSSPFVTAATRDGAPVLFRGSFHGVGPSPLLQPLLTSPLTSYSSHLQTPMGPLDSLSSAVSAFQGRNNARVTFFGSLDMFTDRAINSPIRISERT